MSDAKRLHDKQSYLKLRKKFDTDKEIADYLGVSAPTVCYWKKKHIGKDYENSNGVYFRENKGDGHFQINICNEKVISEHSLAALAGGADPHDVFNDSTHVHHLNKISYDNRPNNVVVVDEELHTKIHQNEEWARREGLLNKNTARRYNSTANNKN